MPDNIEICNFGSSHGLYGYNYVNYNDKYTCFNFGLSSQTLSYDYRLMDYYQNRLSEGCTVFITLSYFSFIGIDETEREYFESLNQRYYKILDKAHIKEYSETYISRIPCFSVPVNSLISILLGKGNNNKSWYTQTADDIDLATEAKNTAKSHLIVDKLDENGDYIINQEEIDALYSMLRICNENNYKPIFITTPYLSEYTDNCEELAPEGVKLFYQMVDELVKDTGISYYDFSHDKRFSNRHDLFMDDDHLNEAGSLIFTDILMQEVLK